MNTHPSTNAGIDTRPYFTTMTTTATATSTAPMESTEMYTMNEAMAREHMRQREHEAREYRAMHQCGQRRQWRRPFRARARSYAQRAYRTA